MRVLPNTPIGRRRDSRLKATLDARLVTVSGSHTLLICDLSMSGARLSSKHRLRQGAQAVLSWLDFEAFGAIVWTNDGVSGMEFDQLLDPSVLIATRNLVDFGLVPTDESHARQQARAWSEGQG
jgi:hypothetical protein